MSIIYMCLRGELTNRQDPEKDTEEQKLDRIEKRQDSSQVQHEKEIWKKEHVGKSERHFFFQEEAEAGEERVWKVISFRDKETSNV